MGLTSDPNKCMHLFFLNNLAVGFLGMPVHIKLATLAYVLIDTVHIEVSFIHLRTVTTT